MTAKDLKDFAAKLSERIKKLTALAQSIDGNSLETVKVDGVQKFARGVRAIDEFAANVQHGIDRERLKSSDTF